MALQDRVMEETKERKNVEEYVRHEDQGFRSPRDFAAPRRRSVRRPPQRHGGLVEDGEDETKGVYNAKLEE